MAKIPILKEGAGQLRVEKAQVVKADGQLAIKGMITKPFSWTRTEPAHADIQFIDASGTQIGSESIRIAHLRHADMVPGYFVF